MTGPALALAFAPTAAGTGLAAIRSGKGPDAGALMLGRSVEELRRLLPALFGLCRSVQEWALALALDLPPPPMGELRRDMIRDHLARLCLHLPRRLGQAPLALPAGWQAGGEALQAALGPLPAPDAFEDWLAAGVGLAAVLGAVARAFGPGEAVTALPAARPDRAFDAAPAENSLAVRHAGHPLLHHVLQQHGPGPLSHLVARLIDLDALAAGAMPPPHRLGDGTAVVPCSRGFCALRLRHSGGMVTAFDRRTPTDHLLMPGGLLDAALATLPPARAALAPLLADILDPCLPLAIGAGDA